MSQSESAASDEEQGEPGSGSIFDFLYHDERRISSFLAQFDNAGYLRRVVQSEGVVRARRGFKASIGGDLAGLGGAKLALERGPEKGAFEGSDREYDPYWANARTLLDFLHERQMMRTDLAGARIGQFVLASGSLNLLDLALFKGLYGQPALRDAVLKNSAATTPEPDPASSGQSRNARRAARRAGEQEPRLDPAQAELKNSIEAGLVLMGLLPHPIQARLAEPETGRVVWASLREEGLVTSSADMMLKHGTAIAGEWRMLGVLDALPDVDGNSSQITESGLAMFIQAQALASADNPWISAITTMWLPMRTMLGRPPSAYGVTPLLIFRAVHS